MLIEFDIALADALCIGIGVRHYRLSYRRNQKAGLCLDIMMAWVSMLLMKPHMKAVLELGGLACTSLKTDRRVSDTRGVCGNVMFARESRWDAVP